jgi:hypothetical protein
MSSLENELDTDRMTGKKHVDTESDFWNDWDVAIDGPPEAAVYAVECGDGMYWDCCDETAFVMEG